MKNFNAEFIKGAADEKQFPDYTLPEVAFVGRSNVGKSSLLNSILLRKNLARTSASPGKTREINFFSVDGKWSFADMPGFGYASIGKSFREKWEKLNFDYLENRQNLRLVCSLVDSRHDPMDMDLALMEWLENHRKNFVVILTKTDKISKKRIDERQQQLSHLLQNCQYAHEALPYSVLNNTGRNQLISIIKKYCDLQ